MTRIYLIDSNANSQNEIVRLLAPDYAVACFADEHEFFGSVAIDSAACLVVAHRPGHTSSLYVQDRLAANQSPISTIVLVSNGTIPFAVQSMQRGAVTVLQLPVQEVPLTEAIDLAVAQTKQVESHAALARDSVTKFRTLSEGEVEVLWHLLNGLSNKMIAKETSASVRTIERRRSVILKKMHVDSLPQLAILVTRLQEANLIPTPNHV